MICWDMPATVPFDDGIRRTVQWYKNEYEKNICIEPEAQANGMGRVHHLQRLPAQ